VIGWKLSPLAAIGWKLALLAAIGWKLVRLAVIGRSPVLTNSFAPDVLLKRRSCFKKKEAAR